MNSRRPPIVRPEVVEQHRVVLYEHTDDGSPLAIEVIEAPAWADSFVDEAPEDADVRVVLLGSGRPPVDLPSWLGIEAVPSRVGELGPETAPYARTLPLQLDITARRHGRRRVPERPRAQPIGEFADFVAAGAAAVRHPAPVPADRERRLRAIEGFCRGRSHPLDAVAQRTDLALEWWLVRQFATPDGFADALLIERVRDGAPELAAALIALREATVPTDGNEYADLALDRQALLSLATPWRYVEGADMAPALAAVRAWLRRYGTSFDVHAAGLRARAASLRARLEIEFRAVRALERLDSMRALGDPVGLTATVRARVTLRALEQFEPTALVAPLGREPALFAEVDAVTARVHAALEVQRERLAAAVVGVILDRPGTDPLERLLQAIQAADLDDIARVLDARLAAYIEAVLDGAFAAARQPLGTA